MAPKEPSLRTSSKDTPSTRNDVFNLLPMNMSLRDTTDASTWSWSQGQGFPHPQTPHLSHGQLSVEGSGADLSVEEALDLDDMLLR